MRACTSVLQATKIIYAIAWTHVGEELSGISTGEAADAALRRTYEGGVARVEHLVSVCPVKGGRPHHFSL